MNQNWQQAQGQAIAAADRLADGLTSGWRPQAIQPPIHLQPGEGCFVHEECTILQFLEGNGSYLHSTSIGFGAVGLAMAAGTALGNHARKRRAEREAVARFRPVDVGRMYLTNQRFAIQGRAQWMDIWFQNVRMSSSDGMSIFLEIAGSPALAIHVWPAAYHFVLFRWLAHGEILHSGAPPLPSSGSPEQRPAPRQLPGSSGLTT